VTDRWRMGELEQEVLAQLWAMEEPATPAQVLDALGLDLAYTTVMTVLTRLWEKRLVRRERRGRAYAYSPALTEAELASYRMRESLARASDRHAALSHFVGSLSARETRALQGLLDEMTRTRRRR
jgi:predicted transcriptional regulator